ncbi:hypothetical protein Taro_031235 [Colocasia esculenta]|uniref:Uncharacterized protein n=1 Tax=Colocasia esculenta TaxID=4460 RepID=A0A843W0A1_COLES|nr:hypothetical protein [Colocasia esculenta]
MFIVLNRDMVRLPADYARYPSHRVRLPDYAGCPGDRVRLPDYASCPGDRGREPSFSDGGGGSASWTPAMLDFWRRYMFTRPEDLP